MPSHIQLVDQLAAFPAQLIDRLTATPSGALDFVPPSWAGVPSERLTIRQQICHLRDIEIDGYGSRFDRVLKESGPILPSIESYGLILSRRYDDTPIDEALGAFAAARARSVAVLASVAEEDLYRRGEFEGYGPVTLLGLIHFLSSHDAQHIAGIEWLLGVFASR